ncbi:MAG: YegS/Rv2252/BmrU family lipid kinase [Defluviitaleaceae bacterium]|nr:YegS/Rv2252/BmrU family lipid kinase [Defluviitaleaceae bacterium]MCL2836186.1 YegS/Rv2252/BmrU family lipid kinase [Defluviitaleaceae bacterium]
MLLIFNPNAGQQRFPAYLYDVVNIFTLAGFLVTVLPTRANGCAGDAIARYAEDHEYVVCSGGDGTIGECIDALLQLEKRPVFGVIPSGTANDFAVSLGIPKDIISAAGIITGGNAKALDIGRFGSRHFSYVAGFGIFTDVAYSTPQNLKNVLGSLAYLLEGIKRLGSIKTYGCGFMLDGEAVNGGFILGLVANTHSVGGFRLPGTIDVRMDDGMFEVILLKRPRTLRDHQQIIASLRKQENGSDLLIIRKASKVEFSSPMPVAWTLDGDFGGECKDVVIENVPHAINVMVPG